MGLSGAEIGGVVAGCICGLLLLAGLVFLLKKYLLSEDEGAPMMMTPDRNKSGAMTAAKTRMMMAGAQAGGGFDLFAAEDKPAPVPVRGNSPNLGARPEQPPRGFTPAAIPGGVPNRSPMASRSPARSPDRSPQMGSMGMGNMPHRQGSPGLGPSAHNASLRGSPKIEPPSHMTPAQRALTSGAFFSPNPHGLANMGVTLHDSPEWALRNLEFPDRNSIVPRFDGSPNMSGSPSNAQRRASPGLGQTSPQLQQQIAQIQAQQQAQHQRGGIRRGSPPPGGAGGHPQQGQLATPQFGASPGSRLDNSKPKLDSPFW
jgi:hypothetical protein